LIFSSYGDPIARETRLWVRDTALLHASKLRFRLRKDAQRQDRFITDTGGGLLARGLHSGYAVYPGAGVVVDDPLKNWADAHSETKRQETWNEIVAVARLRLRKGGWFILAHTRWHIDDPSARFHQLADELGVEVEFVTLPMLATSTDDVLGRVIGEPIEPARYDLAEAKSRAQFLGSYLTAALEQQDPQPEQGGEVQRGWWQWTSTPPDRFTAMVTSWDMKLKSKESGDYVVGLVAGRIGARFWILDMARGQYTQLQTKVAIAWLAIKWPDARRHLIENTGNGPEVLDELRSGEPHFVLSDEVADKVGIPIDRRGEVQAMVRRGLRGLIPISPQESKLVRARRVIPDIEGGNVTLPEGRAFALALVDEWAAFPPRRGGHDDIVDATTQALDDLGTHTGRVIGGGAQSPQPVSTPSPAKRAGAPSAKVRGRILR
jgi:phage terminase large subunit-like protein